MKNKLKCKIGIVLLGLIVGFSTIACSKKEEIKEVEEVKEVETIEEMEDTNNMVYYNEEYNFSFKDEYGFIDLSDGSGARLITEKLDIIAEAFHWELDTDLRFEDYIKKENNDIYDDIQMISVMGAEEGYLLVQKNGLEKKLYGLKDDNIYRVSFEATELDAEVSKVFEDIVNSFTIH